MDLTEVGRRLKQSLERTGYVSDVNIFWGEFHQDTKYNKNPFINYTVNTSQGRKESEMHRLEKEIRYGFYRNRHENCHIRTCIETIGENKEKHYVNYPRAKATGRIC